MFLLGCRIFAHSPQMPHIMVMTLRLCAGKCFLMLALVAFFFRHIVQLPPLDLLQYSLLDISVVWSPFQFQAIISNERLRHHQLAFKHISSNTHSGHGPWIYPLSVAHFVFYSNPKLSLTLSPVSKEIYWRVGWHRRCKMQNMAAVYHISNLSQYFQSGSPPTSTSSPAMQAASKLWRCISYFFTLSKLPTLS